MVPWKLVYRSAESLYTVLLAVYELGLDFIMLNQVSDTCHASPLDVVQTRRSWASQAHPEVLGSLSILAAAF